MILKLLAQLLFVFLAYNLLANVAGGLNLDLGQLYFELPLFLASTLLLSLAIKTKPRFKHIIIATTPWLAVYAIMDTYYILLGRVFKWAEVGDLPELYDILPLHYFTPVIAIPTLLVAIFVWQLQRKSFALFGLLFFLAPLVATLTTPALYSKTFEHLAKRIYIDERTTVGQNGRWLTSLYYESLRKAAIAAIDYEENWAPLRNERIADQISNHKNVHIIIMESWLDPSLFSKIDTQAFSSIELSSLGAIKNLSQSPVYGGQTPQAEFEILCATPAKQKFGTIEFNNFSGGEMSCLPNWLGHAGWKTVATHAYKPTFFNRPNAYRSLGFDSIYFPKDYAPNRPSYLEKGIVGSQQFLFDGQLFEQNLSFVSENLNSGPILNYVLGVYGHWPNALDHPDHELTAQLPLNPESVQLNRVATQYYYRSKALASYLKQLMELDPNSIILVASDHLPPITDLENWQLTTGYNGNERTNIYYLFIDGKPVALPATNHYDMIKPIMEHLCQKGCGMNDRNYIQQLSAAMNRN